MASRALAPELVRCTAIGFLEPSGAPEVDPFSDPTSSTMAPPSSPKQRILDAVQRLPADASFDDVMERLYFLYKIERGLADADAGRVIPHAEVKRQFGR